MKQSMEFFAAACICLMPVLLGGVQRTEAQTVKELNYYNVKDLVKNGQAFIIGKAKTPKEALNTPDSCFYYRLPSSMYKKTRQEVWDLAKDGAGIAIRFSSDATAIGARWILTYNFNMAHMAATGIRGLDLYTLDVKRNLGANSATGGKKKKRSDKEATTTGAKFKEAFRSLGQNVKSLGTGLVGSMEGKEWKFAGTAFPNGKTSNAMIISKMDGDKREYMLYLPLYDGIESLEIGINSGAKIYAPQGALTPNVKTDAAFDESREPIVFYGTSVTQGGCATRPGMAYPSIISRALNKETVNLGFSGNGRMDKSMADYISQISASGYVIDCLANCTYEMTRDSSAYFIARIASAHPYVPVYMVSNYHNPKQFLLSSVKSDLAKENALWKSIYEKLYNEGATLDGRSTGPLKNLRYLDVSSDNIIDNEDTVDGTHLTDKGFAAFAAFLLKHIK